MDSKRKTENPDIALSAILSSYLLSEPPSPSSALPSILNYVTNVKPISTSQVSHKWNTRISSLIQSKSAQSRYWGVCLAKATIGSGGEGTAHVVTWTKLLLTILNVRSWKKLLTIAARGECVTTTSNCDISGLFSSDTNACVSSERIEFLIAHLFQCSSQLGKSKRIVILDFYSIAYPYSRSCNSIPA